jgi:uncharacterized protein (TIRG00374 family)
MEVSAVVKAGAYIGLFFTPALPLILVIFSKKPAFMQKITRGTVNFLYKIKIVRNREKWLNKAQTLMNNFLDAFQYLGKHKSMILLIGAVTIVDYVAMASIPYLVVKMFGGADAGFMGFLRAVIQSFYITLSSGVVPTPGGSGAAEGSFYSIFQTAVQAGFLFWAVLFWRIMVFYLPIFLGILTHFADWLIGKKFVITSKKDVKWRRRNDAPDEITGEQPREMTEDAL